MLISILSAAFVIISVVFLLILIVDIRRHKEQTTQEHAPVVPLSIIEALTWFLCTFGVSDAAINMVAYRLLHVSDTRRLPGTMLVGAMIPIGIMSVGYLNSVEFSHVTLIVFMIVQSVGGFIGASLVKKLDVRVIRVVMACAMLATAAVLLCKTYILHIEGGTVTGLTGVKLVVAAVLVAITEALTMMGFGNTTANICILLALGMHPLSVYPIVMTANSTGCLVGCFRFIKDGNYIRKAALIEGVAGTVGVLLAVRLVTSMDASILQLLMIALMLYSAVSLFRENKMEKKY